MPTDVSFFGVERARRLADDGRLADLVLGNNVLAQVPDLNDFVAGIPTILAPDGTVTIEFPHLLRLLEENQFDTIYHEHYCYFSLISAEAIFAGHGMTIFDVEELWTHGGSLRIYARHAADTSRSVSERVTALREREEAAGFRDVATYERFEEQVRATKRELLGLLSDIKSKGGSIAGYGAPGQGQHVAQLLRDPHRLHRLHGGPKPVQTGPLPARHAHPDPPARAHRRDTARLHLHPAVELQGRDPGADGPRPRLGREVHRPDPAPDGPLTMLEVVLGAAPSRPLQVLCVGAHSDDIEIGSGGTVLRLLSERPGTRVRWVVLSATDERERARASAEAFLKRLPKPR